MQNTLNDQNPGAVPSFRELVAVFARIGALSFGGPAGQIGMMHKTLVEERRWLSEERFLHALNYCMLLPGPEAQQLATYIGWLLFGVRGGIVSGLLFVLPGLAIILGLSAAYVLYQDATWLAGLFFGLKAAVLAIVVEAVIRLGRRTLKTTFLRCIAAAAFVALFFFSLPFPLVVFAAGLAGYLMTRAGGQQTQHSVAKEDGPPGAKTPGVARTIATLSFWILVWQSPVLALWAFGAPESLSSLFGFFSKMALVTFGGAYAVLAYVAQVAVADYGWLKPGEMLDGLALAETTPGPLVLVLSFVGFLVGFREASGLGPVTGGIIGGLLVAWATFVPSFVFIFAGAPLIERLRGNALLSGALSAITAAVVGVILNLAVWFGLHVLFKEVRHVDLFAPIGFGLSAPVWSSLDPVALMLFAASAVMLFVLKLGMVPVLAISAAAGFLAQIVLIQ